MKDLLKNSQTYPVLEIMQFIKNTAKTMEGYCGGIINDITNPLVNLGDGENGKIIENFDRDLLAIRLVYGKMPVTYELFANAAKNIFPRDIEFLGIRDDKIYEDEKAFEAYDHFMDFYATNIVMRHIKNTNRLNADPERINMIEVEEYINTKMGNGFEVRKHTMLYVTILRIVEEMWTKYEQHRYDSARTLDYKICCPFIAAGFSKPSYGFNSSGLVEGHNLTILFDGTLRENSIYNMDLKGDIWIFNRQVVLMTAEAFTIVSMLGEEKFMKEMENIVSKDTESADLKVIGGSMYIHNMMKIAGMI